MIRLVVGDQHGAGGDDQPVDLAGHRERAPLVRDSPDDRNLGAAARREQLAEPRIVEDDADLRGDGVVVRPP